MKWRSASPGQQAPTVIEESPSQWRCMYIRGGELNEAVQSAEYNTGVQIQAEVH